MLVVLEGLDGAGKSTQVKRLKKYLEDTRPALEYIHFPRYEAPVYGDLISRFLRGDFGNNETVHPQLVALPNVLQNIGWCCTTLLQSVAYISSFDGKCFNKI